MYFENIRPEDIFRQHINGRGILVDVRDREQYRTGHIPGARNIPYEELQYKMSELKRSAVIIVYCDRGNTSLRAARDLSRAGFRVKNVYGGMQNYHGPITSD